MELQEVKQFLKDNADKDEVKSYLAEFKTDEESIIKKYKESQEFISEKDRAVTQAIKTYNEKTVPGLIQKEVEAKEKELLDKYEKPKDPKEMKWEKDFQKMQEQLSERDQKLAERDRKIIQKEIKNKIHSLLGEKKIDIKYSNLVPVDYNSFTIDDIEDEELLMEKLSPNVDTLASLIDEARQSQANEMYQRGVIKPQDSNYQRPTQLTRDDLKIMSPAEITQAKKDGKLDQILGR